MDEIHVIFEISKVESDFASEVWVSKHVLRNIVSVILCHYRGLYCDRYYTEA